MATRRARKPAPARQKARPKSAQARPRPQAPPRKIIARARTERRGEPRADVAELLGQVSAPSGEVVLFDVGMLNTMPVEDAVGYGVRYRVASERALPVVGVRVGKGEYPNCWEHVALRFSEKPVAMSETVGEVTADYARLLFIDARALTLWRHDEPMDGLADLVFWGRDAEQLAQATHAEKHPEGWGWSGVLLAEAVRRAKTAERLKEQKEWKLTTDLRPHSHHFLALRQLRASPTASGVVEVAGSQACLFATSWGAGVFPVFFDRDDEGEPVRLRVQLHTADSHSGMENVKPESRPT